MGEFLDPLRIGIAKYIEYSNSFADTESLLSKKLRLTSAFLKEILQGLYSFEENIQFNITNIGHKFQNNITSQDYNEDTVDEILIFLIRAAKEFEINSEIMLGVGGLQILSFFKEQSELYSESLNIQIYYAFSKMPFIIFDNKNKRAWSVVKDTMQSEMEKILANKLPEKNKEIESLKNYIDNSIEQLNKLKQKFSFVSLNKAFYDLSKSKNITKNITLSLLIFLALIIVYIPYFYYEKANLIGKMADAFNLSLSGQNTLPVVIIIYSFVPMVIMESIFIYFFRIVLQRHNSLTEQIIQLETKQAIIQFIESYVDYKKDKQLKEGDVGKFEEIIFSKISPNLKDIPDHLSIISLIETISKAIKK